MTVATISISKCVQDIQEMGGAVDASVMRSRVFFSLSVNGKTHEGLYVDISQPYGTDYAAELIEVSRPIGYDGPFAHRAFCEHVEAYYRQLVGQDNAVISIGAGSSVRMTNNTFHMPHQFQIEVDTGSGSAW